MKYTKKIYCPPQIERIEIDKEFSFFSPLVINSEISPKALNTSGYFYEDQTKMNIEIEMIESDIELLSKTTEKLVHT